MIPQTEDEQEAGGRQGGPELSEQREPPPLPIDGSGEILLCPLLEFLLCMDGIKGGFDPICHDCPPPSSACFRICFARVRSV